MTKCMICGKEITTKKYIENICSSECFEKQYWNQRVKRVNEPTQVVINGYVYQIEREDACGSRGFDGAVHYIKFFNGRIIRTTNLWSNGLIPEEFREKLPNNATWSNYKEYEKYEKKHS